MIIIIIDQYYHSFNSKQTNTNKQTQTNKHKETKQKDMTVYNNISMKQIFMIGVTLIVLIQCYVTYHFELMLDSYSNDKQSTATATTTTTTSQNIVTETETVDETPKITIINSNTNHHHHDHDHKRVLILTPLKDASKHLQRYFDQLITLTYPKHLVSLGFLVGDDSSISSSTSSSHDDDDNTFTTLQSILQQNQKNYHQYHDIKIIQKSFQSSSTTTTTTSIHQINRHGYTIQQSRRSNIAKVRNYLLSSTLSNNNNNDNIDYVFWLDSDVHTIPTNIIEIMISVHKPIVVANCMFDEQKDKNTYTPRSFDLNSWVDTTKSIELMKSKPNNQLMLEGYSQEKTYRTSLNNLRGQSKKDDVTYVVELNGVGGTALMVDADVHRQGIIFPSFVIDNAIETEGLCRVAERNGLKCYGLPNLEVWHY